MKSGISAGSQFQGRKRVLYASHWWLEELMNHVAHYAQEHGWFLDLQMCLTQQLPKEWHGDGILTTQDCDDTEVKAFFTQATCPTVSLNLNSSQHGIPTVNADVDIMGSLAADHFLERGFRTFAIYFSRQSYSMGEIRKAYERNLNAAGHTLENLGCPQKRPRDEDVWTARRTWLGEKLRALPRPVGLFLPWSPDVAAAFDACSAEDLLVPDDIAILSGHSIPMFGEYAPIPLSSIEHDHDTQARVACDLLEQLMSGGSPPAAATYIPPKGLVTRASTDTLAAQSKAVSKAVRYMLSHYAEPISIEQAIRVSGMSRTKLAKEFNQEFNQTPYAVLTRIRLDKAKRMLTETDAKLHQVAEACGFGHAVGLHAHFKKTLNLSPGQYRKMYQKSS